MNGAHLPWLPHGTLLAFPVTLLIGIVSGLLNAGPKSRRRAAVALAMASFVPPFFVPPEHSAVRLLVAMGTVMVVIRSLDLYVDQQTWSAARRSWLMVSVWDSRRAAFDRPRLDGRNALRVLAFAVAGVAAGWGLTAVSADDPMTHVARWLLGATFAYAVFEALHALIIAAHGLFGVVVPPFHRDPILSRSVSEFWGQRWNMIIHEALARHLFRPLARRRRVWLGVGASFVASGLIHAWLMLAALGGGAALTMGSYFLIQGLVLALERPMKVTRWRSGLRRVWTVVAVLGPSPLFLEPLLVTFGF